MKEKVQLPDMGEGVEEATVADVLVSVGDRIEVDQGIVELETDKAVAEVPSPKAGQVTEILVETGQTVHQGDELMTVETDSTGADEDDRSEQADQASQDKQPRQEGRDGETGQDEQDEQEQRGEQDEQAPRARGNDKSGEDARRRQGERPRAGDHQDQEDRPDGSGESGDRAEPVDDTGATDATVPAAPSTRRLARELGVDLRSVEGTGPGGWVTESDVRATARASGGDQARDRWGPIRREKLSGVRRTMARTIAEATRTPAATTHFDDADVTELETFRAETQTQLGDEVRLTSLAFVIRAAVQALKNHPRVNASLDEQRDQIVYKQYIHVGLAVDTDRGLIVPVIRQADRLSVVEIARQIGRLAGRARDGDLTADDMRGGTFTVSNLGSIGGRYATPILNPPQSAILLLGHARPEPVARDGRVTVRTILPVSLTYDHRTIDGAEAARFLNDIIARVSSPRLLLTT